MRHFKTFILAAAIAMTSSVMTASTSELSKSPRALSYEIEKLIQKSDLIIEDDFKVKVFFRLNEEGRIQIHSVSSENAEVNEFLRKRLENKKMFSKKWITGKMYELPVKVQGKR